MRAIPLGVVPRSDGHGAVLSPPAHVLCPGAAHTEVSPPKGEAKSSLGASKVSGFDGVVWWRSVRSIGADQGGSRTVTTVAPSTTMHVPGGLGPSRMCVEISPAGRPLGKLKRTYVRAWLACVLLVATTEELREIEIDAAGSGWSTASASSPVPGVAVQGCRPAGQLPGGDGDPRHACIHIHARSSIGPIRARAATALGCMARARARPPAGRPVSGLHMGGGSRVDDGHVKRVGE